MDDGVSERFGKNWSVEEERTLLDSYRAHGPNWDLIQSILPQRKGIVSKWKRLVATGNQEAIDLQKTHRVLRDKRNEQEAAQAAANGVSHVPLPVEPDSPGDSGLSGNGQSSAKRARRAEAFEASKAHGVTFEQQTQYSHSGGGVEQRSGPSNQPSSVPGLTVTSVGMGMGGMGGGVAGAPHSHLGAPMAGNLAGMAPTSMAFASLAPSATHAAMQLRRDLGYLSAMGGDITTVPPLSLPNQGLGGPGIGGHAGAAERTGQGHSMGSNQLIHQVETRKRRHEAHEPAHMNAGGSNGMSGLTVMGEGLGLGLGLDFAGYNSAASTPNGAAALAVRRAGGNAAIVEAEAGAPAPQSLPEGSTIIYKTVTITVQVPVPIIPAHVFPDPQHAQEWMHEYATAYADHYANAFANIHGDAHVRAYHDYVDQVPIRTAMAARAAAQRVTQMPRPGSGVNVGPGEGAGHRTGLMQSNSSGVSAMGHALSTGGPPGALQLDLSAGHSTGLTSPSGGARSLGRLGANVVGLASLVEAVESESAGEDRDRGHDVAVAPAPVGSTMPGPLPPLPSALSPLVPRTGAGAGLRAYPPSEHKMEHGASAGSDGEATVRTYDSAGGSTVTTEGGSSSSSSTAASGGEEQASRSAAAAAAESMAGAALQRMVAVM